jgi:hypothetical protein
MVYTSNNHSLNKHQHADISSVLEPEPQEQILFALAELEPEGITVRVPEPDLDPNTTKLNEKKSKKSKMRGQLSRI